MTESLSQKTLQALSMKTQNIRDLYVRAINSSIRVLKATNALTNVLCLHVFCSLVIQNNRCHIGVDEYQSRTASLLSQKPDQH